MGVTGNTKRAVGSDSLGPNEREVLRLWDAGYSMQRISDFGFKPKFVNRTVSMFVADDDDRIYRKDAQLGSAKLADAIAVLGGHR